MVINETGKTVEVGPFTKTLGSLKKVKVVDCAVAHDCPYSGETRIIVMFNALHVPSMEHNLVPPFVVRRRGNTINDVPKIQCEDPTEEDHSLKFEGSDARIQFQLVGTTSYFDTRLPTIGEVTTSMDAGEILELNTEEPEWNPHDESYARQESLMLDFEGRIIEQKIRDKAILNAREYNEDEYEVSAVLQDISNTLGVTSFAEAIKDADDIDTFCGQNRVNICQVDIAEEPELFTASSVHTSKSAGVSPEDLAKIFRIDIQRARRTVEATTQNVKRSKDPTLSRRYSTNDRALRYRHIKELFFMDTFFATGKAGKTTRGHTCMQIFVTDKGFVYVVPLPDKSGKSIAYAISEFFKAVGIPDAFICDKSPEQTAGEAKRVCNQSGTAIRALEPNTPWANRAELYIGIFKDAIRKELRRSDCPLVLWDYCAEHKALTNNVTVSNLPQAHGQTPYQTVYNEEADISNVCQFAFYDWGTYLEASKNPNSKFPLQNRLLCRVLGPSKTVGTKMTYELLRVDGMVVPRSTVIPLTDDEVISPIEIAKRKAFDNAIRAKLGTSLVPPPKPLRPLPYEFDVYEDDEEEPVLLPETDDCEYDHLINAEVLLPHQDQQTQATVLGPTKTSDGEEKGRHSDNPILNTKIYDVMFPDGAVKQYAANVIAENMWAQVDQEGHQYRILEGITGHRKDSNAVERKDQFIGTKGGRKLRQTTAGWDLCVAWKDGSEQWVNLKDIKGSNPLEVAEYARANSLEEEPAFRWWVPYTLKKRKHIISAIQQRVRKNTHKYGIKVPKTIEEAYALDKANGNSLWRNAIAKEMKNVSVAFEILEREEELPVSYKLATCHIIFDVKMDFTRKARYVLDGHRTEDPQGSTYAGVVSRESVRIAFTYAALNGIDIMAADVLNAYLQAPASEKHYIVCGLEFGLENKGKRARIVRALYGGKAAGRDFRNSLRSCMEHLGFDSCKADPDVWMRKAVKSDGSQYWEYVLLYTDDALVVSENAERILREEVGKYFELKEASIGPPDIYLGGKVSKVQLENGMVAYTFSSSQYVKSAIDNVEKYVDEKGAKMPCRANTPLSPNYRPEVDVTDELEPVDAAYYQSLIGILRWMVELGRVDITCEVSMMSSHLALPRVGHLNQLLHMFAYLKKNHNSELVFDPSDPDIDKSLFERKDWTSSEFGLAGEEEIPANAPEARGQGFTMSGYVDADHATDSMTRKSRTGFIIYLNNAPIYWLSRKQLSVESSSFGSEFCAMKQCTEYVRGLRYKLRMMGIAVPEPTYLFGDNQSVLYNATCPDSMLKKKSNSIAYHFVREGSARDEWRITYINTHLNVADLLTKPLPAGEKRMRFIRMIIHHL